MCMGCCEDVEDLLKRVISVVTWGVTNALSFSGSWTTFDSPSVQT